MPDSPAPNGSFPAGSLPYGSEPLAALLSVFTRWGSGGFIHALAENAAAGAGELDATSIVAVTTLAREGAMRPSALAERLRVGASNVSKISARLAALGLVQKVADPADSRASLLQLTPQGEAVMASLVEAGDRMMAEILADWPSADRAELGRLLARFERDAARHALGTD
ncbi:MarR family winged helix-turn-helix transcriptional regulator [Microterricola pindariensis]|uniref:HTH marR-type domain-containing protein n=1 Tax=Microterricola pindariensis TaxID=478010 RepID=A0ABX5AV31_9MICO|nr:MarR family transcriptional regulator [Microterricola pindariensis]PPL16828.1 hypothetical protein GY24_12150 [Microterricola pindariensis]